MEEESSIKVQFEISRRSTIICVALLAIMSCIICIIIAALVSPPINKEAIYILPKCESEISNACFTNNSPNTFNLTLSRYNQFLYLDSYFSTAQSCEFELEYNFTLISLSEDSSEYLLTKNQTSDIVCTAFNCNPFEIFYIPYATNSNYSLFIQFATTLPVDTITFTFHYMNEQFIVFILGVKYFFLTISAISLVVFFCRSMRVPYRLWTSDTILVGMMGISLVIFDEPLLAATLNQLTPAWTAVSVFCNAQFIACLLIYWVTGLQKLINLRYNKLIIIIEAVIIIGIFSLICIMYMYARGNLKDNPSYDWKKEFGKSEFVIYVVVISLLVEVAVWLIAIILISLLCSKDSKNSIKDKVFKLFNITMIVLTFVGIGIGAFQPFPKTGTALLSFISVFNIYFIFLQWLYMPSYHSYLKFSSKTEPNAIKIPMEDQKSQYTANHTFDMEI